MHVWSQVTSLCLSALSLAIALLPRGYTGPVAKDRYRQAMGSKLIRFPIFWLGGAFLLYIAIQALNPAWTYLESGGYWRIFSIPHIAWLPHGMLTPFAKASPWRCLMIDGAAWLTVCAIWVGLTRRRTVRYLFTILAVNAGALATLGILERALNASEIFWSWKPPAYYFVASFIYKNHAGAYFDLLFSVCAGLAAWHYVRSRTSRSKSSPSGLFAFLGVLLVLIVLFSYSRAATLLLAFYCVLMPILLFRSRLVSNRAKRENVTLAGACAILVVFFGLGLYLLPSGTVVERMDNLVSTYKSARPDLRRLARSATFDMFDSAPAYGWGADSFRFAFPRFQRKYPAMESDASQGIRQLYWEHAHNDYAEFLAEFGIAGAVFAAAILAYWVWMLVKNRYWRNPGLLLVIPGCALTLAHAWVDFPFHNPAILLTWCALIPAAVRWAELGRQNIES